MHLWPSIKLRDSFKESYLKNLDLNLGRMRRQKKAQATTADASQKLLDGNGEKVTSDLNTQAPRYVTAVDANCESDSKKLWVWVVLDDLLMIFTCCFCLGACMNGDDE